MDLPDASRSLIWCSHVLEHIADDGRALSEIGRVLEPGGLVVLRFLFADRQTYEDVKVVTEADRLTHFLQEDHVRLYGLDLQRRIEAAGLVCEILSTSDLPETDQVRYGIRTPLYREVFFCQRPH